MSQDPKDQLKRTTAWNTVTRELKLRGQSVRKITEVEVEELYKAIHEYNQLLSDRDGTLREHISELRSIADNLDKVSKGTKIAGITGGATSVAGGVAAAAGVILSPFTMGASLALTAVGVGVAAAGGVTGASAAIAHKVNMTQDKKKLENTLQAHEHLMEDIRTRLKYINDGMSVLSKSRTELGKDSWVVDLAATGGASAKAIEADSKASGLIEGFALGMDFYFIEGKDGQQKVRKGLESKFAKKIRKLAEELNKGLDELQNIKSLFQKVLPKELT